MEKEKEREKDNNSSDDEDSTRREFVPEDDLDWETARRNFMREQSVKIRENYSRNWQRRLMITLSGAEAKVRHRKVPAFDTSVPGVIYVGDRRFASKSFFYFPPDHPMRRGAIRVITDPWYNKFSTVLLIVHILPAVVAEPGVPRHRFSDTIPEIWSWLLLLADRFLLLYFTIELGITFMAYGFLRTVGNWFRLVDLLSIIIATCVDAIPHDLSQNGENVAKYFIALNSIRVFRVVGRIEGMRKLMIVLKSCMPTLVDVAMLLGALVFSFATIGITFFRDAQHNRCVSNNDPTDITHTCVPDVGGGFYSSLRGRQICEPGYNCSAGQPPVSEWGNFDNFVKGFFSIVQLLTLDDWFVLTALIMDGLDPVVYIFFVVAVLLGAFWAMNLILAVVTDAFSRFHANEKRIKQRKKRRQRDEQLLALHDKEGLLLADEDEELLSAGGGSTRRGGGGGGGGGGGSSRWSDDDDSDGTEPLMDDDGDPIVDAQGPGVKGTHPWFKRKMRLWLRHLNAASTASLFAGIQTMDVKSMLDHQEHHHHHHAGDLTDSHAPTRSHHHHHHHGHGDDDDDDGGDDEKRRNTKQQQREEESVRRTLSMWKPGSRYTGPALGPNFLASPTSPPPPSGTAAAATFASPLLSPTAMDSNVSQRGDEDSDFDLEQHSPAAAAAPSTTFGGYETKKSGGGAKAKKKKAADDDVWDQTGEFDDTDLVQLAAQATLMGRATVAATRFRDESSRRNEVQQRVKGIEAWARSMPAADQLSSVPDTEPHWDITEDDMFDPMLVVPDAADTVGTKGIHFYPRAMYRPLNLFERYELAAKRANQGEIPSDQESEDDMDMGFVSEKEMSFVGLRRQLKRAKLRAIKAARQKKAAAALEGGSSSNNNKSFSGSAAREMHPDAAAAAAEDEATLEAQNTWREQLEEWMATLRASYRSYPIGTLVRMVHQSNFWKRTVQGTVIFTAALLSINYYGAPDALKSSINVFTAFNDVVLVVDMFAILYFEGFFARRQQLAAAAASAAGGDGEKSGGGNDSSYVPPSEIEDNKNKQGEPSTPGPRPLLANSDSSPAGAAAGAIASDTGKHPKENSKNNDAQLEIPPSPAAAAAAAAAAGKGNASGAVVPAAPLAAPKKRVTAAIAIDIFVGIVAAIDIFFVVPGFGASLAGIRGLRLFKIAKNFTLLHDMIKKMRSAFYYFASLLLVALSFVMVFSTIGRHVFNGWMPEQMNCYRQQLDFQCNNLTDCVFVTTEEWTDNSSQVVFEDLRSRVFLPRALSNFSAEDLLAYKGNSTLLDDNPLIRQYFNDTEGYSCRQFRNWLESAVPTDRLTFNSPLDAFLTIFNALTKDNFSAVEYRFMEISPWTSILFLTILVFGSYMLISLLIAILLVHFSDLDVNASKKEGGGAGGDEEGGNAQNGGGENPTTGGADSKSNELELLLGGGISSDENKNNSNNNNKSSGGGGGGASAAVMDELAEDPETWAHRPKPGGVTHPPSNIASQPIIPEEIPDGATFTDKLKIKSRYWVRRLLKSLCDVADPLIHKENLEGNSFFLFSPKSGLRSRCCDLISGRFFPFEQTIVLCSMAHCVTTFIIGDVALDNPATLATVLTVDWVMVALSVADLLARCIAQCAILGDYSFFSSRYENKLDFLTIFFSTIAAFYRLAAGTTTVGVAPDMFFRAFRPMRIIIRSRGMKNVALAVYKTLPAMGRVLGLGAALIWMLSIIAVEYFGGVLRRCSDGSDRSEAECIGTFPTHAVEIQNGNQVAILINETRTFRNLQEFNFDNIFFAFTSLTSLAVASQWTNVVFALIDSPVVAGGRPIRDTNRWTVWLVIAWIVIGNFVLLNIFVGTIVDNFSRFKQQLAGALFKTPEEVELNQIQLMLKQTKVKKALSVPEVPFIHRKLNQFCFTVVTSTPFIYWTRVVTIFDMVAIASQHYEQDDNWMVFQESGCRAVSVALWVEVFLKVGISGPGPYLKIWFNRIDFASALVVGVESLMYIFWGAYRENPFLHAARIVSSFRLVRESKSFRSLLKSGLRALPALSNIGGLVFLVFFMASFLAMGLFQNVRTIISSPGGSNYDHDYNFRTIARSMITMFVVATLDNWGDQLQASSAEPPNCAKGVDCGEPVVAQIFFVVYIILVGFIMINLFITVVLENFSESVLVPQYITERLRDVNSFRQMWVTYDPSGRQVINARQFVQLLLNLPGPRFRLARMKGEIESGDNVSQCSWATEDKERYAAHSAVGLRGEPRAAVLPSLRDIPVPVTMPNQEVLFADALEVIGEKIFHISLLDEEGLALKKELRRSAREYADGYTVLHYYAASRIQEFVRTCWAKAGQPLVYKNTILWDAMLVPLFKERWRNNAESIYKVETTEEATMYRKLTLARGLAGAAGDKDGGDKEGGKKKGKGARGRSGSKAKNSGKDGGGGNDGSPASGGGGVSPGSGGDGGNEKQLHIRPLLSMGLALGSKMTDVEEVVEEDTSWKNAVPEVDSDGSSWADDEGEQAWLPASAISGQRTLRSVGVAPECRRHGGVYELVSVDELISRRQRERDFVARFPQTVRQRLQSLPARTREKWAPMRPPDPNATGGGAGSNSAGELVKQSALGLRGGRKGRAQTVVSLFTPSAAEEQQQQQQQQLERDGGEPPSSGAAAGGPIEFDDSEFTGTLSPSALRKRRLLEEAEAASSANKGKKVRGKDGWLLSQLESKKPPPPKPLGSNSFSPFATTSSPPRISSSSALTQEEEDMLFGGGAAPAAAAAASAADMDDALLELEQRIQQERLRHVSRLGDVAMIRNQAPQLASDLARERSTTAAAAASASGGGTGSSPPKVGSNTAAPGASYRGTDDKTSSSLAAVRSSIFSSNRLRNWTQDSTANLVAATADAAQYVPTHAFTGVDPDLQHLVDDEEEGKKGSARKRRDSSAASPSSSAAAAAQATRAAGSAADKQQQQQQQQDQQAHQQQQPEVDSFAAAAAGTDAPLLDAEGKELSRGASLFKKVSKAAFAIAHAKK